MTRDALSYLAEAQKLLQLATSQDRSSNFLSAVSSYRQAVVQFQTWMTRSDRCFGLEQNIQEQIDKVRARLEVLENNMRALQPPVPSPPPVTPSHSFDISNPVALDPRIFLTEGHKLLQLASAQDRANNGRLAVDNYREAITKFEAWLASPDHSLPLEPPFRDLIDKARARIEVLENRLRHPPAPVAGPHRADSGGFADSQAARDRVAKAILVEKQNIRLDDVAGLATAKHELTQSVILPMKIPHFFQGLRTPCRRILLYGPPGTGKSFLAKAIASEIEGAAFLAVSTGDLFSKYFGESEGLLRGLFATARAQGKTVIFIDEIDSLVCEKSGHPSDECRRVKTELLVQMDRVGKSSEEVLVLAATSIPWQLEPAVRRQFDKKIYVTLLNFEGRLALLKLKTKGVESELTEEAFQTIAHLTEGFSGADIDVLCRDAEMVPVDQIQAAEWFVEWKGQLYPVAEQRPGAFHANLLTMTAQQRAKIAQPRLQIAYFQSALMKTKPSVASADLRKFEEWAAEFGSERNWEE
jgi:vacuolar protein-sorting-associated protein 4